MNNFVVRKTNQNTILFNRKLPKLAHLDIELTERCNNNCIHCYINLPENDCRAKSRELDTEQWKDVLQQAADLGALSVRFTGGEPLLRHDFQNLYLYARRLGMKVIFFTNARLVTKDLIELFQRVPPLAKIEVSAYGMHANSYDAVTRVPGAFNQYRNGLQLLIDNHIPFVLKSVLLPPNKYEVLELEAWASTILGMSTPSHSILLDLRTRRDSEEKNTLIKRLRVSPEQYLHLISQEEDGYRQAWGQFSEKFLYPQGDQLFNCGAGHTGCVDAYGNFQMCMLLRHPDVVYDLKNGSLHEGLTEVFPKFRELRATNLSYLNRCAKCFLKGLCEQCPARSWSEHGTLDTPVEYLCRLAHIQACFLGLLKDGEKSWEVEDWKERIKNINHYSK